VSVAALRVVRKNLARDGAGHASEDSADEGTGRPGHGADGGARDGAGDHRGLDLSLRLTVSETAAPFFVRLVFMQDLDCIQRATAGRGRTEPLLESLSARARLAEPLDGQSPPRTVCAFPHRVQPSVRRRRSRAAGVSVVVVLQPNVGMVRP
jgi:hypothetical protein